uniref:Uncharacterized protein n=1 Tax=Panagrolaimus sp. JU765 TaxID=591449 RepID=A0AC34RDL4_9BILA
MKLVHILLILCFHGLDLIVADNFFDRIGFHVPGSEDVRLVSLFLYENSNFTIANKKHIPFFGFYKQRTIDFNAVQMNFTMSTHVMTMTYRQIHNGIETLDQIHLKEHCEPSGEGELIVSSTLSKVPAIRDIWSNLVPKLRCMKAWEGNFAISAPKDVFPDSFFLVLVSFCCRFD